MSDADPYTFAYDDIAAIYRYECGMLGAIGSPRAQVKLMGVLEPCEPSWHELFAKSLRGMCGAWEPDDPRCTARVYHGRRLRRQIARAVGISERGLPLFDMAHLEGDTWVLTDFKVSREINRIGGS